ncbi:MAG: chemotaxis protein CheW [Natrialbaceae archaeon]|nr:chemotaxis protein CheW [Natrialbaceae archaeon]
MNSAWRFRSTRCGRSTDPPESITKIPRTPDAVEGVIDIRGEITAVIDPRIHFPAEETHSEKPRLVVFDRPSDQQQAATIVDEVIGVISVPEDNVRFEEDIEDRDIAGGALDHPLVVGIVEQERTVSVDTDVSSGSLGIESPLDSTAPGRRGVGSRDRSLSKRFRPDDDDQDGQEFVLEEDDDLEDEEEEIDEKIVVEMTAMIDIDGMLRASGQWA